MRWLKKDIWKIGIVIIAMLLLLLVMAWIPVSAAGAHEGVLGVATPGTVTATPTVDVTAVAQDLLKQQDDKLQRDNSFPWILLNAIGGAGIGGIGTIFLAIAAFVTARNGLKQWQGNRKDEQAKRDKEQECWQKEQEEERRKRDEGRFQNVVTGLGSEREDAKVGAAIMLRTFLREGYEQFYTQVFDLAVAHLRLPRAVHTQEDRTTLLPLTTLSQALIAVFKEAFPLIRREEQRDQRSLDATGIRLDSAYLQVADLRRVWMPNASLRGADLRWANLSEANLQEVDLGATSFVKTDLSGARLFGAHINPMMAFFLETNFSGANLCFADLSGAVFKGSNFSGADLSWANLRECDLGETNLEDALSLEKTDLCGAKELTKEQLVACKAKGAIIDEDLTTNSSQSTIATSSPSQSDDAQASSTSPAQGSLPTPDTGRSSAASSTNS